MSKKLTKVAHENLDRLSTTGYDILGSKMVVTPGTPVYSALDNSFIHFPPRTTKVTINKVSKTRSGAIRGYWTSHRGENWTYLN